MKLYNKSKDYIKNKHITHLKNKTAVLFKLFHWGGGGGGGYNEQKEKGGTEEHKNVGGFFFWCFKANKIPLKLPQRLTHQQNNTSYCMLISWWPGWGYFDKHKLQI